MNLRALIPAAVVVTFGVMLVAHFSEPRYRGRTLTSWLQEGEDLSGQGTPQLAEAQNAVRAIGAKRAVPRLLRLVGARDDRVSLWLIAAGERLRISERFGGRLFRWREAGDFNLLGMNGFEALGTNAAAAAPGLEKLLAQPRNDLIVETCLDSIGKAAEPVMCRALTNQDVMIREWAVGALASVTDDVGVYLNRIQPSLHDSSYRVRIATVDAIGAQADAPDLAVPLLIQCLNDSTLSERTAQKLGDFGTNGLTAFAPLAGLVDGENQKNAAAALKALVLIAPDAARPILARCVSRGKPRADDALRALANTRPDDALPLVLDVFRSGNATLHRTAFRILLRYPLTPAVESVMQTATTDSDTNISRDAKSYLTEKYLAANPIDSQFSGEPVYAGKSLGEWLKTNPADEEASFLRASNAVQQIGPQAIPWLLKRLVYTAPPFGLSSPEAYGVRLGALHGFVWLGAQALPALPQLRPLMESTNWNIALFAMVSSDGTGSNAMPFFIAGLTNRFAQVRSEAANLISDQLNAPYDAERKQAVPLLVALLHDPDEDVRMNATNALKTVDPAAAAHAGIK